MKSSELSPSGAQQSEASDDRADARPDELADELADELSFAPESTEAPPPSACTQPPPWKVLVIDDEPEILAITQLALAGLMLDGRTIGILSASSAVQARQIFRNDTDIAVVLLDVVMEQEHAGLDLARWIREELGNRATRIVLRTGQPGLAPEQRVMIEYDINDYRSKTELTAQRLVTTILGGLRSYRDLMIIEEQKRGLSHVIEATASLFERNSLQGFLSGVLTQLAGLFGPKHNALFVNACRTLFGEQEDRAIIVAGSGRFRSLIGSSIEDCLAPEIRSDLLLAVQQTEPVHRAVYSIYGLCQDNQARAAVYIETSGRATVWENSLAEIFCRNAAVAMENLRLHERQVALLRAVERFVPNRLLGLLGSADVTQVRVGEHVQREMTVVFADLRGFTALAERLSPHQTFAFLNAFFAALVPAIHAHGGVVDKYLGDGIMALFPGSAEDAVRAALAMIERTRSLASSYPELPTTPLLGVGIHQGQMILGLLGAADRIEFTAVSDSVNITSRVERLTRTYDVDLLITREVFERIPAELQRESRLLGEVEIRGKHRRVEIFEVFAADAESLRAQKEASRMPLTEVIEMMQAAQWQKARDRLAELRTQWPQDRAIEVLDRHCWRQLRLQPAEATTP